MCRCCLLALDVPQAASGAESARGLARVAGANLQIASVVNDPHFPSPHLTARAPAIKSRKPSPRGVLYHPLEARCKRISMDAMRCAARSRRRKPAGFSNSRSRSERGRTGTGLSWLIPPKEQMPLRPGPITVKRVKRHGRQQSKRRGVPGQDDNWVRCLCQASNTNSKWSRRSRKNQADPFSVSTQ
jgi:hypothetical protein